MKNIKKFESFTYQGEYWLLPTDERFEKSLKEIGCPKQQIFRFLSRHLITHGESENSFLIPKGKEDIFEWIKDNVKLPYRIISKMRHIPFRFYRDDCGLSDMKRKDSEEWTKKIQEKYTNNEHQI